MTGAYCLLLGWGVYRAAEGLLKKVKKLFGESRGKNEEMEKDLREKLADYKSKVDDAWEKVVKQRSDLFYVEKAGAGTQGTTVTLCSPAGRESVAPVSCQVSFRPQESAPQTREQPPHRLV